MESLCNKIFISEQKKDDSINEVSSDLGFDMCNKQSYCVITNLLNKDKSKSSSSDKDLTTAKLIKPQCVVKTKVKIKTIELIKEFNCQENKLKIERHKSIKYGKLIKLDLEKKQYSCDVCFKELTSRNSLSLHLRIHSGDRPYACQICHKSFLLRVQLREHSRLHSGERPFVCAICNKSYTRKSCLSNHTLIHTGELAFHCDLCHKKFARKYNLIKHFQSHSGDRPFLCHLCPKRFKSKQTLDVHYKIHTNRLLNIYKCNVCQENFNTKIRLTRHKIREHSGYRPFTCHVCRKPFIFKSQLTSHIKEHNIIKPFSCTRCQKSYMRQGHLISHIKAHCSDLVPAPQVKLEVCN